MRTSSYKRIKRIVKSNKRYNKCVLNKSRFDKESYIFNERDFFDSNAKNRISELAVVNPFQSIEYFKIYLENYPQDFFARCRYIQTLINIKQVDAALIELNNLEIDLTNDSILDNYEERKEGYWKAFFYTKLKYLIYSNNYEEAYKYICFNQSMIPTFNLQKTIVFLKYNLSHNDIDEYMQDSYSFYQITDYSDESLMNHISKHLAEGNIYLINRNSNIFSYDFPIKDVINEVKKYLNGESALYLGLIEDTYCFKYDNCGKQENKFVDYFRVVCYHNTDKIITIVPVKENFEDCFIDLNYLKDCKKKIKCD